MEQGQTRGRPGARQRLRVCAFTGLGGHGWAGGTRRKSVLGGSHAPSMAHDGPASPPVPTPAPTATHTHTHEHKNEHEFWRACSLLFCFFDGHRPTVWGGGVWVRGTVVRHGWRTRASTDGFTACPANPHIPAQPGAGTNATHWLQALALASKKKKQTPNPRHEKTRFRGFDHYLSHGAQERTRTSTKLPPLAPEASASTNSATWATQEENSAGELKLCQQHFAGNFDAGATLLRRSTCRVRHGVPVQRQPTPETKKPACAGLIIV